MPRKIVASKTISFGPVNNRRIILPNVPQKKRNQNRRLRKTCSLQKKKMLRDSSPNTKTIIHKEGKCEIITAGNPLGKVGRKINGNNRVIKLSDGSTFTAPIADVIRALDVPKLIGQNGFLSFMESNGIELFGKMRTIYVRSVLTPLEARGKGHGDKLFARVEREARKRKIGWVYGRFLRSEEKTLGLLQRRGWREIEASLARAGLTDSQVVMAKRIRL